MPLPLKNILFSLQIISNYNCIKRQKELKNIQEKIKLIKNFLNKIQI